jgi:hypothetical protein
MQGYLSFKAYREFDAERRADGWNTWLTLAISPATPPPAATAAKTPDDLQVIRLNGANKVPPEKVI